MRRRDPSSKCRIKIFHDQNHDLGSGRILVRFGKAIQEMERNLPEK